MSTIIEIIKKVLSEESKDKNGRGRSWVHCYNAFSKPHDSDYLALHLAFYLASWGMYRGSSGLLQKDYKIHDGAVGILLKEEYKSLRCSSSVEVNETSTDRIIELKDELIGYYSKILFKKTKKDEEVQVNINGTDTLISKILLGTLACAPAFDTMFLAGIHEKLSVGKYSKFDGPSLKALFDFTKNNQEEIKICQALVQKEFQVYCSVMKILDMYFWQLGYKSLPKSIENKEQI